MWISLLPSIISTELKCYCFLWSLGFLQTFDYTPRMTIFVCDGSLAWCCLISSLDKDEAVATTVYVFIMCPWSECAAVLCKWKTQSWKDLLRLKLNSQPDYKWMSYLRFDPYTVLIKPNLTTCAFQLPRLESQYMFVWMYLSTVTCAMPPWDANRTLHKHFFSSCFCFKTNQKFPFSELSARLKTWCVHIL